MAVLPTWPPSKPSKTSTKVNQGWYHYTRTRNQAWSGLKDWLTSWTRDWCFSVGNMSAFKSFCCKFGMSASLTLRYLLMLSNHPGLVPWRMPQKFPGWCTLAPGQWWLGQVGQGGSVLACFLSESSHPENLNSNFALSEIHWEKHRDQTRTQRLTEVSKATWTFTRTLTVNLHHLMYVQNHLLKFVRKRLKAYGCIHKRCPSQASQNIVSQGATNLGGYTIHGPILIWVYIDNDIETIARNCEAFQLRATWLKVAQAPSSWGTCLCTCGLQPWPQACEYHLPMSKGFKDLRSTKLPSTLHTDWAKTSGSYKAMIRQWIKMINLHVGRCWKASHGAQKCWHFGWTPWITLILSWLTAILHKIFLRAPVLLQSKA